MNSPAVKSMINLGVSIVQAEQAFRQLGEAAKKAPFPTGEALRSVLMHAWRRDHGLARFFYPRDWKHRFFGL